MGLLDDKKKSQYLQMAEEKLQGLLNLPMQAQRFITNPTAFLGLLGQNPLPRESGFAEGFGQLPAQTDMSVLDPNQAAYMGGYESGVPVGLLASVAPFTKGMPVGASIKDVSKETANAMKLAQKNAALPIEKGGLGLPKNNTSMDRAKALGYDTPFFHGQKPQINKEYIEGLGYIELDPQLNLINEIKKGAGKAEEGAFFGTIDADIASKYATKKGIVYPLMVRSQDLYESGFTKPYPLNGTEKQKDLWIKEAEQFNRELDKNKERYLTESILNAEKANKGGTIIRNIEDNPTDFIGAPQTDILAIQSAPVRSRFAAFDPMQKKSRNIMAGLIPFGLLSGYEEE